MSSEMTEPANDRAPLVGRATKLDALVGLLSTTASMRTVLVTGRAGAGRSALLRTAAEAFTQRGADVVALGLAPRDEGTRYGLLYRLALALQRTRRARPRPHSDLAVRRRNALLDAVVAASGGDDEAAAPDRLAAVLAATMTATGQVVVLIDDAHHADPASMTVLAACFGGAANFSGRLVLALRGGSTAAVGDSAVGLICRRLVAVGQASALPLEPLSPSDIALIIAARTDGARPDGALVETVAQASGGNPRAAVALLDALTQIDGIQVIQGHAMLRAVDPARTVAERTTLLADIRWLGPTAWATATGMALLHPLGAAAVPVLAADLSVGFAELDEVLTRLVRADLLVPGHDHGTPGQRGWSFRIPVEAAALRACVGPARSQKLAAAGATIVLSDAAEKTGATDDAARIDLLVTAGGLVDPKRGLRYLLEAADRARDAGTAEDLAAAVRWYSAALDAATEPAHRAGIRLALARVCLLGKRWSLASAQHELALDVDVEWYQPAERAELGAGLATAVAGLADRERLVRLAKEDAAETHPAVNLLARATALAHLGSWSEVVSALSDEASWSIGPIPVELGRHLLDLAATMGGRAGAAHLVRGDQLDPVGTDWPATIRRRNKTLVRVLRGEPGGTPTDGVHRTPEIDALSYHLAGDWTAALRAARLAHATGQGIAYRPVAARMYQCAAEISFYRGEVSQAHAWVDLGRAKDTGEGGHLLDLAEARVFAGLGHSARATELCERALAAARDSGVILGVGEILAMLADLTDEAALARTHVAELHRLAATTGRIEVELLAVRSAAVLDRNSDGARAAVELARELGQPAELARSLLIAARLGVDPQALLAESYALFGDLDALVWRAETRAAQRATGATMPRREMVLAETERLLAHLVASGLTNRELAVTLRTTAKAVEGQLGRLFSKTGVRSRVELAAVLRAGDLAWLS